MRFADFPAPADSREGRLEVLHTPLRRPARPGQLDAANAPYVIDMLARAAAGCLRGEFAAMVTAPVNKAVINEGGIPFTGHTEYLAERTRAGQVVMMLAGGGLKVALATTHVPLADVPAVLTRSLLETVIRVICGSLARMYRIERPHLAVAGLNPHAGEGGHLGREEIDVIVPVLEKLRHEGLRLTGPMSADTMFLPQNLAGIDCVLAMYHDQGLPVLKVASFGRGINVTLGLPIVRTSVDHGTALPLAATGRADSGSLLAAVDAALEIAGAASAALRP